MAKLILPSPDLKELIRDRRKRGADRLDEVWDGTYVMAPPPNNEHATVVTRLCGALLALVGDPGAQVIQGCGVTDRREGWKRSYRVPDVSVFLPGNAAEDCGTHWYGGPDLAIEVVSPKDRSRKKLGFYAKVGVRELLLVDRDPWRLELYRLDGAELKPAGVAEPGSDARLLSGVTGLELRLLPGESRPRIELRRVSDGASWLA
jgi:Uma2 family endonuclease